MINVTGIDLVTFIKKVYDLSISQGLGCLYYQAGGLTSAEARQYIRPDGSVNMDYVKGRACKMSVQQRNGTLFIHNPWFDHSDEQLRQLLEAVGISPNIVAGKHSVSCNCIDCQVNRDES